MKTIASNQVLKKESVYYIQSRFNKKQANLLVTLNYLILEIPKSSFLVEVFNYLLRFGVFVNVPQITSKKTVKVFEIDVDNIDVIEQGLDGIQKNVLEITTKKKAKYRICVKNYRTWSNVLEQLKD
jgi:hypothetical protein